MQQEWIIPLSDPINLGIAPWMMYTWPSVVGHWVNVGAAIKTISFTSHFTLYLNTSFHKFSWSDFRSIPFIFTSGCWWKGSTLNGFIIYWPTFKVIRHKYKTEINSLEILEIMRENNKFSLLGGVEGFSYMFYKFFIKLKIIINWHLKDISYTIFIKFKHYIG